MGAKGSGKTKQMVELINKAAENEIGSVVCIELGRKMMFDVSRSVRLVEASEFSMEGFSFFKGFISGMYASNYDLTHVFIDSLCKIIPSEPNSPEVEEFLAWLDKFSEKNNVKFTITISADVALATDAMKAYF
jgi:predicted ATP-grasp superfamily ATP-dependent carboligase